MPFDALKDHSDAEYAEFVGQLVSETTQQLAASNDATQRRAAIAAYIERAYDAHLSPSEITDFFCVSSNSVIDLLAASNEEANVLVAAFDALHDDYCRRAK